VDTGDNTTMEELAGLLRARGADGIDHPSGTLGAHLERVQRRLARLGASPAVQLAARAHAVYGTDGFDVRLLQLGERHLLAGLIGGEAERLVYRYAACDRAATWAELPARRRLHDRFTGEEETLTGAEVRDFADLTLVNEIDVAEHAPRFRDAHGAYFRRLTAAWTPLLSPAVAADAAHVFG
jgi:hypothetical protein